MPFVNTLVTRGFGALKEVACLPTRQWLCGPRNAIEIGLSLGGQCQPPCRPIDEPHTEAALQSRDEPCDGDRRPAYVLGFARQAAAHRHALEKGLPVGERAIREIPS